MVLESRGWASPSQGPATFAVVNLGCKVNRVESDGIAAGFIASGLRPAQLQEADIIVINTCTVTGEADKKARKAVRRALGANASARVMVTGCGVAVDADSYRQLDARVETVDRMELLGQLPAASALRVGDGFPTRVSLKVQDGCDHACTYCIVHIARGPARSMPLDEALVQADSYLSRGVKEIVLAGIDLGAYRFGTAGLAELVSGILEIADKRCRPGDFPARVRVSSIEPGELDAAFVELLASSHGRLCRHLHLPLQSGSSRVLSDMARPYDAFAYGQLVGELYDRVAGLSLTTDVIVGFPGEGERDFEETLKIVETCRFSKVHVFPYSARPGTPAARRPDQVAPEEIRHRAARLRELSEGLRKRDLASRKGTVELAVVEPGSALTESYHQVPAPDGAKVGALVSVEL